MNNINENCNGVIINDICYPNDYDHMYNLGLKHPDKSVYKLSNNYREFDTELLFIFLVFLSIFYVCFFSKLIKKYLHK